MRAIEREIAAQPECWRRAAGLAQKHRSALPARGARIAITGAGTSLYVAQAAAALREVRGHGETDAFPASEMPVGRDYDLVIAISRSGTTTEVVRLLERLPGETLLVTAVPDGPAVAAAAKTLALEFADEESVVQTRFATSALALLRAHLGEDVEALAAAGEAALSDEAPLAPGERPHLVFLGAGFAAGLANEAALKLREATGSWTESYPVMEYRHGPISAASGETAVWGLSSVAGLRREIEATGAVVIEPAFDPMAELVRVHRYAVDVADARGLDPERPRHLARSVVLDG